MFKFIIFNHFFLTFREDERDPLDFWKEQKMETELPQVTMDL
jgi:hypothetical protein